MKRQPKHFYEFGSFRSDPAEHNLLQEDTIIPLTPKVFDTLLVLVENNRHLVEKDELRKEVWSDTIVEESNPAKKFFNFKAWLHCQLSGFKAERICQICRVNK